MKKRIVKKKATVKVRHTWSRKPVEQAHTTKKGKKGYKRVDIKKVLKDEDES